MKTQLLFIISLCIATSSFACSCKQENETAQQKIEKSYLRSDLILTGKVVEIIKNISNDPTQLDVEPIIYRFEITEFFKGKNKKKIIEISSAPTSSACGYTFTLGTSYLVYSHNGKTSLCDRNQSLKNVTAEELKILRNGDAITEKTEVRKL